MKIFKKFFLFLIQYIFYYLIFIIFYPFLHNKRIYIVCERGNDARDNGYWMFKHIRENHPYVNIYYLINKKSADYCKVASLGKVVKYKSLKHWVLYCCSEVRMSTHLASFAPGSYIGEWFKKHKQKGINVFLQHGITHNEFPSNYYENNGSDLVICGASREYETFLNKYHFPRENLIKSGFPRFDGLVNNIEKKQILIMPTWRMFLENIKTSEFSSSKYFLYWSKLLSNEALIEKCKSNKVQIIFYPHYSMQKFISLFSRFENEVVKIANFNLYDVQDLLTSSSMLITDYSSILFDFAYLKKPQLLYQFDYHEFYGKHYKASYFDHKRDGFGTVCREENELVNEIFRLIKNDFAIDKIYLQKIEDFFCHFDCSNCERTYQEIVRKYIKNKKKHKSVDQLNAIVAADDYGRNFESSEGIRQAFKLGYIDKTSVIVNKDERDCIDNINIDKSKVGLHINLTEGYKSYGDGSRAYWVEDPDSVASKCYNNKKSYFRLNKEEKNILVTEVECQIQKYQKLGFTGNFFDSHGHIHTKLPIAKCIVPLFLKYNFDSSRLPSNIFKRHFLFYIFYKKRVIYYYRKHFRTADYFCSCDDFIHIKNYRKLKNKTIEIMTHPFIDEKGKLINRKDIDFKLLYEKNV